MLSGEYAVLRGGTAVLVPVPRHLTISEAKGNKAQCLSRVMEISLEYSMEETREYEELHGPPRVTIDDGSFFSSDSGGGLVKLGLGLSAAEAVGIVALRFERAGLNWLENRGTVFGHAEKIHRLAQAGIGSGADVALCAYGQPIRYRKGKHGCMVDPIHRRATAVPLSLAWTRQPADTRRMVKGFDDWTAGQGPLAARLLRELVQSSNEMAAAWSEASPEVLYGQLDRFCAALEDCMHAARIPYELPIHRELGSWARGHGGRAKPTGAGGGDMILLVGDLPLDELDMITMPLPWRQACR
jgi:mevalonate kinase